MSNASDFIIESGVLKKYVGPGGDVVIPAGVSVIGAWVFDDCAMVTSVTIPENVTKIDRYAFDGCENLHTVQSNAKSLLVWPYAFQNCTNLRTVLFNGEKLTLAPGVFSGCFLHNLTIRSGAIENINLVSTILRKVSPQQDLSMAFDSPPPLYLPNMDLARALGKNEFYTEGLLRGFIQNYDNPEIVYDAQNRNLLLKTLKRRKKRYLKPNATDLQALFVLLSENLLTDTEIEERLQLAEAEGQKQIITLLKNDRDSGQKMPVPQSRNSVEQMVFTNLDNAANAEAVLTENVKGWYGMDPRELPKLTDRSGATLDPIVLTYLLTCQDGNGGYCRNYNHPGVRPDVQPIVDALDPESFRAALRKLADDYIGWQGYRKKMMVMYPVCRYADNDLMLELTRRAAHWRTSSSGINAPPLLAFRDAVRLSNTRAAMLFADKYNELEAYADFRKMDVEVFRDVYLSDVGLDSSGRKHYDLGNQTVTAVLQQDLSFLFTLPEGKTVKTLPKKGTDPEKYQSANADFAEMKKSVKGIVKNRKDQLFTNFLNGRPQGADHWQEVYLKNPLLCKVANLVVWSQGDKTFILDGITPVTADGAPYTIGTEWIRVAHPMVMCADDVQAWQNYFTSRGLKQPFEQIWEPVLNPQEITADRYKDCMIPFYRFKGREKHGIIIEDYNFHNDINIYFAECSSAVERVDWVRHEIDMNHRFTVQSISFDRFSPMVNHILAYLDKCSVYDRILKDDASVAQFLSYFTLAQITEFIKLANENNCYTVKAILLDYQKKHFPVFDPMAEFTL